MERVFLLGKPGARLCAMEMVAPLRLVIDDSAVTSVDQTVPILDWSWRDEDPPASHSAEMVTRVSEAML